MSQTLYAVMSYGDYDEGGYLRAVFPTREAAEEHARERNKDRWDDTYVEEVPLFTEQPTGVTKVWVQQVGDADGYEVRERRVLWSYDYPDGAARQVEPKAWVSSRLVREEGSRNRVQQEVVNATAGTEEEAVATLRAHLATHRGNRPAVPGRP